MQATILWAAMTALVVPSMAYLHVPARFSMSTKLTSGHPSMIGGFTDMGGMPVTRRDLGKFALLGGTVMAPLFLNPSVGQCKQKRSGDGGKWARHYGEFSEEELDGFTQTASGLKYKDVVVGDGAVPTPGNSVQTHYSGYLLESGNLFDSSYERGKPLAFKVGTGQVIKGWDEGLLSMKVGSRRQLIIPASLAYGARQVGPIPANSDLVFYVELLAIGA